jgi:hypothetical protein
MSCVFEVTLRWYWKLCTGSRSWLLDISPKQRYLEKCKHRGRHFAILLGVSINLATNYSGTLSTIPFQEEIIKISSRQHEHTSQFDGPANCGYLTIARREKFFLKTSRDGSISTSYVYTSTVLPPVHTIAHFFIV